MTRLTILFSIFLTFSCVQKNKQNEILTNFINEYKNKTIYNLNERLYLGYNSYKLSLIDTTFLKPLELIDTSRKNEQYGIKYLHEYNCRIIGILNFEKFDFIITDAQTIRCGGADPVVIISSFNKEGKKISSIKYAHVWQRDYTPECEQYLTINDKNEIHFELIEKNYELIDSAGIEVRKYVNTTYTNDDYIFEHDGQIKRK